MSPENNSSNSDSVKTIPQVSEEEHARQSLEDEKNKADYERKRLAFASQFGFELVDGKYSGSKLVAEQDVPELLANQAAARDRILEIIDRGGNINANVRASITTEFGLVWDEFQDVLVGLFRDNILVAWQGVYKRVPSEQEQLAQKTMSAKDRELEREARVHNAYAAAESAVIEVAEESQEILLKDIIEKAGRKYPEIDSYMFEAVIHEALLGAGYTINSVGLVGSALAEL